MTLEAALADLTPILDQNEYLFVYLETARNDLEPVALIREGSGVSYVIRRSEAQAKKLKGDFPCRRITLGVTTALDLVGFMARVAAALAAAGIAVNPMAGVHHDHLFVADAQVARALEVLDGLAAEARRSVG